MHSFISNFRHNYILKTLGIFLLITFSYYIVVYNFPKSLSGVSQWQDNILKAQGYMFSNKYYPVVVVGSSELYNVHIESLSENVFNLSMGGGSSSTGLEIINQKVQKPKIVLVEMNDTLLRKTDKSIIEKIQWWNIFPWNRENTRPDYLIISLKRIIFSEIKRVFKRNQPHPPDAKNDKNIQYAYEAMQNLINEGIFRENVVECKKTIDSLISEGCRIVLIEPPNDVTLRDTPQFRQVHSILQEYFPDNQYEWVTVDWSDYITGDGIHLAPQSANRYAAYLFSYIAAGSN